MTDNIYVQPSAVLINGYNDRVKSFSSRAKRDVSWVLEDNDKLENVKATVSIPGFPDRVITINRQNLPTLIPATDGDIVVVNLGDVQDTLAIGKTQREVCKAFNITNVADQRLYTKAFAHAVLLWTSHQVLISPDMVSITDLTNTEEGLAYAKTVQGTLIDLVEIKPIVGALDYVGSIKVASVTSTVVTPPPVDPIDPIEPVDPPVEEVPGEFDLGKVTNSDTPGHWTLTVDVESDEVPEAPALIDLTLAAVNTAYDTAITTADVTSNLEGKTLTIYTLKENISSITGTLIVTVILNVTPPPVEKFDLSTITNGDETGVWTLDINEDALSEVTAQSATQAVLDVFNVSSDTQITYEQLTFTKEDTLITVTPSKAGAEVLEGSFIITLNVINNEVPQSNTGLASDYPGTGWYKATDTGTVFCKGVVENETCIFDEVTYTSVYTAAQAKALGSTAAVSNVTNMNRMSGNDSSFNADISSWDVSNVTDMSFMFSGASVFNQDISNWGVINVTDMGSMFSGASVFNQDLSSWCVTLIPTKADSFDLSASSWTLPKPVWGTCPRGENVTSQYVSVITIK